MTQSDFNLSATWTNTRHILRHCGVSSGSRAADYLEALKSTIDAAQALPSPLLTDHALATTELGHGKGMFHDNVLQAPNGVPFGEDLQFDITELGVMGLSPWCNSGDLSWMTRWSPIPFSDYPAGVNMNANVNGGSFHEQIARN
jgi:hypothetical protein